MLSHDEHQAGIMQVNILELELGQFGKDAKGRNELGNDIGSWYSLIPDSNSGRRVPATIEDLLQIICKIQVSCPPGPC